MVLDGAFAAAGDEDQFLDPGGAGLFDAYWIRGLSTTAAFPSGAPWWREGNACRDRRPGRWPCARAFAFGMVLSLGRDAVDWCHNPVPSSTPLPLAGPGSFNAVTSSRISCRAATCDMASSIPLSTLVRSSRVSPRGKSSRKMTRSVNPGTTRKPIRFESSPANGRFPACCGHPRWSAGSAGRPSRSACRRRPPGACAGPQTISA